MRRRWLGWKYALMAIGLAVLALLIMDFNSRMASLRRLSEQERQLATEVADLLQTRSYLETQIAYATSEAAVRRWAAEDGHQKPEGDVAVVPLPSSEDTPQPTPTVVTVQRAEANWQIWLSLFTHKAANSP